VWRDPYLGNSLHSERGPWLREGGKGINGQDRGLERILIPTRQPQEAGARTTACEGQHRRILVILGDHLTRDLAEATNIFCRRDLLVVDLSLGILETPLIAKVTSGQFAPDTGGIRRCGGSVE
jgi:hypothetical protein